MKFQSIILKFLFGAALLFALIVFTDSTQQRGEITQYATPEARVNRLSERLIDCDMWFMKWGKSAGKLLIKYYWDVQREYNRQAVKNLIRKHRRIYEEKYRVQN